MYRSNLEYEKIANIGLCVGETIQTASQIRKDLFNENIFFSTKSTSRGTDRCAGWSNSYQCERLKTKGLRKDG